MRARCWVALALLLGAAAAAAQPPLRAKIPEVTLSNGLRVLGCEDRATDLVGVFLGFKVGAEAESSGLRGARLMLQEAFRHQLEQQLRGERRYLDLTASLLVGQGLDLTTEWDYVALVTLCPRQQLRNLLQVLGEVLFTADLTPEALAAGQRRMQQQWEAYGKSAVEQTYYLFRAGLLGNRVAAQPVFVSPDSFKYLTRPALEQFRRQYFVPANALLVMVGPSDPERLVADAVGTLVGIPRAPAPQQWLAAYPPLPSSVHVGSSASLRRGDVGVASLMVGFRFPAMDDPDYAAGLVLYAMLTGPQGSLQGNTRLMRLLAQGLWGRPLLAGDPLQVLGPLPSAVPYVAVHAQTNPAAVEPLRRALVEALGSVSLQAADAGRLSRGRRRALNGLARSGMDQQARARRLGEWSFFAGGWTRLQRLPYEIQAVQAKDVQRVAQRCFAQQYVAVQMPE